MRSVDTSQLTFFNAVASLFHFITSPPILSLSLAHFESQMTFHEKLISELSVFMQISFVKKNAERVGAFHELNGIITHIWLLLAARAEEGNLKKFINCSLSPKLARPFKIEPSRFLIAAHSLELLLRLYPLSNVFNRIWNLNLCCVQRESLFLVVIRPPAVLARGPHWVDFSFCDCLSASCFFFVIVVWPRIAVHRM